MRRVVKERDVRREEILDVAQRLIYTKGYEPMTVRDILAELQISNGAFYHHFESKLAILEALSERLLADAQHLLTPIVEDPDLFALGKLQGFFTGLINWKNSQRSFVVELLPIWFADENAIVRQKLDVRTVQRLAPLLTIVMRQGMQENAFAIRMPEHTAQVVLALIRGLQDTLAEKLLVFLQEHDVQNYVESVIAANSAYMDAIERTLGIPEGTLQRVDADSVKAWASALETNAQAKP